MHNSIVKKLYHWFVSNFYGIKSFRGGWALTHFYYLDYKEHLGSYVNIAKAHLKGWSYSDWNILGVTNDTQKAYLSTRDYCSLHPLNGIYSSWIDDKLSLKYILNGTIASKYMPDYYYEITSTGRIVGLMDLDDKYDISIDGIISLLHKKNKLAFKLEKASLGIGFFKVEYIDGNYYLNGELIDLKTLRNHIYSLRGYLITEFLLPHPAIAKYCTKSVGCLRYLIGRKLNGDIIDIYSFMRFGTKKSKFVENYNSGGVLSIVHDGHFSGGNILDCNSLSNIKISAHPDNALPLEGNIPYWEEVKKAAHSIAAIMPQLTYLGIDFCITNENKVKIIEINSLSSLDSIQLDKSILESPGGYFFKERLTQ